MKHNEAASRQNQYDELDRLVSIHQKKRRKHGLSEFDPEIVETIARTYADSDEVKRRHWAELLDAMNRECVGLEVEDDERWNDSYHDRDYGKCIAGDGKDYESLYLYLRLMEDKE